MTRSIAGGVFVPIVSPFDAEGRARPDDLAAIAVHLADRGVDGLLVTGTTGEACALTPEERSGFYRAAVGARCTIFAGTGAPSLREAEHNTALAAEAGCHAAVVITPFFQAVRPAVIERYFTGLAESKRIPDELPLLFYHNPARTFVDWPTSHVAELADRLAGRFVGIKDSANDAARVADIHARVADGFTIFAGSACEGSAYGRSRDGVIDAVANMAPSEAVAAFAGDAAAIEVIRRLLDVIRGAGNGIGVIKAVMCARGLPAGVCRRPFDVVSADSVRLAKEILGL